MASLLVERMPSVERVRFLVSGTETNLLALRLARAHTGRTKLAKARAATTASPTCWSSADSTISFIEDRIPPGVTPGRRAGRRRVPVQRPRRRRGGHRARGGELAAVIVEPIMGAAGMVPATHGVPPAPARGHGAPRHRADLRRGRDLPDRLRRRAGPLRRHARPDLDEQGDRRRSAAGGARRPRRDHGPARPRRCTAAAPRSRPRRRSAATRPRWRPGSPASRSSRPRSTRASRRSASGCARGIDAIGARVRHPAARHRASATSSGMHWAPERVVDYRTRMQDDSEKITNLGSR